MNYKDFNLGDWIGHISGVIEDESELDGNEMRDLVEFLSKFPKWIPISEKLPEKNIEVLATTESGYITIAEWFEYDHWFTHEGTSIVHTDELIAWMPLPKPYKADIDK